MKNALCLAAMIGICWIAISSVSLAAVAIDDVGTNPFPDFPATGGTGTFNNTELGAVVTKDFTSLGDVPIIINDGPSTGLDTMQISERVTNHTGVDWTDFHLIVQSIDASPALSVGFLNVVNSTGQWTSQSTGADFLSLFGLVKDGDTFSLSFNLAISASPDSFNLFGIHETPSVPEPGSLVLMAVGTIGLLGYAVRRRLRAK
jgi:hypothetical protein